MHKINNTVIEHRLCVDPTARKIKQKCQSFSIEKYAAIAKEVDHLLAQDLSGRLTILSSYLM